MSAAEIIERIKALPDGEQEEVFRYVEAAAASKGQAPARYAETEAFDAAVSHVLETYDELLRKLAR